MAGPKKVLVKTKVRLRKYGWKIYLCKRFTKHIRHDMRVVVQENAYKVGTRDENGCDLWHIFLILHFIGAYSNII